MDVLSKAPVIAVLIATAPAADVTTTYTYNADGALTSITHDDGNGKTTKSFLTWDNFLPDQADAASGIVRIGDGNLTSLGPAPGGAADYSYDVRARLVSQGANTQNQRYTYHANSQLSAAELANGTRRFYQNHQSIPKIANILDTDEETGARISARLRDGRYLNDGTKQAVLAPRKDVAGILDLATGQLAGNTFDPFGVPLPKAESSAAFDLADPPDGFADAYTDPVWGGVYLHARWYDPAIKQFLSRDPRPNINRFGYAGGNPISRTDPSGMSFWTSLGHDINQLASGKTVADQFARFFLAPFLAPMEIAADPKGFWDAVREDRGGIDVFLALGIATEFMSIGLESYGWSETIRTISASKRIFGRRLLDLSLGTAQAVTAGAKHGFKQFSWSDASASLEMSYGALGWSHYVFGIGYHPFTQRNTDLIGLMNELARTEDDSAIVFRERDKMFESTSRGRNYRWSHTTPLLEKLNNGYYHEAVLVVTRNAVYRNELYLFEDLGAQKVRSFYGDAAVDGLRSRAGGTSSYQQVGRIEHFTPRSIMRANPLNLYIEGGEVTDQTFRYNMFRNNCHHHASAVLQALLHSR